MDAVETVVEASNIRVPLFVIPRERRERIAKTLLLSVKPEQFFLELAEELGIEQRDNGYTTRILPVEINGEHYILIRATRWLTPRGYTIIPAFPPVAVDGKIVVVAKQAIENVKRNYAHTVIYTITRENGELTAHQVIVGARELVLSALECARRGGCSIGELAAVMLEKAESDSEERRVDDINYKMLKRAGLIVDSRSWLHPARKYIRKVQKLDDKLFSTISEVDKVHFTVFETVMRDPTLSGLRDWNNSTLRITDYAAEHPASGYHITLGWKAIIKKGALIARKITVTEDEQVEQRRLPGPHARLAAALGRRYAGPLEVRASRRLVLDADGVRVGVRPVGGFLVYARAGGFLLPLAPVVYEVSVGGAGDIVVCRLPPFGSLPLDCEMTVYARRGVMHAYVSSEGRLPASLAAQAYSDAVRRRIGGGDSRVRRVLDVFSEVLYNYVLLGDAPRVVEILSQLFV